MTRLTRKTDTPLTCHMLVCKGYHGTVELDEEAGLLHGEVVDVRDVTTFQAQSVNELKKAFRDSIDDYLDFCHEAMRQILTYQGQVRLDIDLDQLRGRGA